MASVGRRRATVDDLYRTSEKAELIGGRIVKAMPTGFLPHQVAFNIAMSLKLHQRLVGGGVACADNLGFVVPRLASGRESFSPDAAFYAGPLPANLMRFVEGPPTLAVEVRSEGDYGPRAEAEIAAERADYFEAGTLVVWDVDPTAGTIRSDRADRPGDPSVFARGRVAEAEPAVPGWRPAVDDLLDG